jgi:hypothetical protein
MLFQFLLNRSTTRALSDKTPYEAWYGSKPAVQFLRTFGCLAYVKELECHGKLEDGLTLGVFIGYEEGGKDYQVLDPITQRVRTMRDVVFDGDHGWNWSQEEDGNTGCNSDFVIEYVVEAMVAAEESATPHPPSASPTSHVMSPLTTDSISSTSGGEATLVRPEHTGLSTWHTSRRIRDVIWPTLYNCCNYL